LGEGVRAFALSPLPQIFILSSPLTTV